MISFLFGSLLLALALRGAIGLGESVKSRRPRQHEPRLLKLLPPAPCRPDCGRPRRCASCSVQPPEPWPRSPRPEGHPWIVSERRSIQLSRVKRMPCGCDHAGFCTEHAALLLAAIR